MRQCLVWAMGVVVASATLLRADERQVRFVDLNESVAWITTLTSLPEPFKSQIAAVRAAKTPGQFELKGDLNLLLAHFGLSRQAIVMDPESLLQTPITFRGSAKLNFQNGGDCSSYPDHIVLDYKTLDGQPLQNLVAFLRPAWLSPIEQLESENLSVYEKWRVFARQHIQQWEEGVDRVPELLQDLEKIIDQPTVVLKDSRRTDKHAGYLFIVKNPGHPAGYLRFALGDDQEFRALPELAYLTCGGE